MYNYVNYKSGDKVIIISLDKLKSEKSIKVQFTMYKYADRIVTITGMYNGNYSIKEDKGWHPWSHELLVKYDYRNEKLKKIKNNINDKKLLFIP